MNLQILFLKTGSRCLEAPIYKCAAFEKNPVLLDTSKTVHKAFTNQEID